MAFLKPLLFLTFLLAPTLAQNTTTRSLIEFHLTSCGNTLASDPNNIGSRTWGTITLYSPDAVPNLSTQYATPQGMLPYRAWEGANATAFFYNNGGAPRGFVSVQIPTDAAGKKTGIAAGKLVFEGKNYACTREYGRGYFGGCPAAPGCWAEYTYCSLRYTCKQRETPLPVDRVCPVPQGQYPCYPSWTE